LVSQHSHLAQVLRNYINICLNYLLYLLLTYAFVCSIKMKKYFIPSS
jgi:hypothetical protein